MLLHVINTLIYVNITVIDVELLIIHGIIQSCIINIYYKKKQNKSAYVQAKQKRLVHAHLNRLIPLELLQ